jgi:putative endonuclease
MEKQPCVYLLASRRMGTLYLGVTSNLINRVYQHRNELADGFTKRYRIHDLVWFEVHESMESAISREKQIKKWTRAAKIALIEIRNPEWRDLWPDLTSSSIDPVQPE